MIKKIKTFFTRHYRRYKRLDRFSARFAILTVLIGLFVLALFINLFRLMVFQKDKNQQRATSQQLKITVIPANRGSIYDKNGETLVQSASAWVVNMEPKKLREYYNTTEREIICQKIAEILGVPFDTVLKRSQYNASTVKVMKKADKDQKDKLNAYIYRDVYLTKVDVKDKDGKTHKEEKVFLTEKIKAGEYPELTVEWDAKNPGEIKEVKLEKATLKRSEKYHYIKGVTLQQDTKRNISGALTARKSLPKTPRAARCLLTSMTTSQNLSRATALP